MTLFSKIKGAKQAADEHKRSRATSESNTKPVPYEHVPTHAASDALLVAPAAWTRYQNRAKTRTQNRMKTCSTPTRASFNSVQLKRARHPNSSDATIQSVMQGESPRSSVQTLAGRRQCQSVSRNRPTGKLRSLDSSPLVSNHTSTASPGAEPSRGASSSHKEEIHTGKCAPCVLRCPYH
jgi:hypothetical protein